MVPTIVPAFISIMVVISEAYMTLIRRLAILLENSLPLSKVIMNSMLPVKTLHIANFAKLVDIFQKFYHTGHVYVYLIFEIIRVHKFSSCEQKAVVIIIWLKVN